MTQIGWRDNGLNAHCLQFASDNRGLPFWPDREDLSSEFTRLLGAAQEGGSTVAECLAAASCIDASDDVSWCREWTKAADINCARAAAAVGNGKIPTARSNWLRAMTYYQAAAFPFDGADGNCRAAIASMRRCAANFVRHASPRGEVVLIPWLSGYPLEAYFLPAPGAPGRAPAVICFGEPGQRKEGYLYKGARYASDRGMALLAVDLFGAGADADFADIVGRRDLETTVGSVMDYLADRDDVDESRIAILADGMNSSVVARGIAFDDRFAAAVCDGGLWDLHEREFLMDRVAWHESAGMRPTLSRAARNIKCPVLIPASQHGWLQPERVRQLYEGLRADGRDVTLKIFTDEETASAQGHADNPTLANEFIFDWIESCPTMKQASNAKRRRAAVPTRRASDA